MCTTTVTKLALELAKIERNRSWLARKLGVKRQSAAAWVNGTEACPGPRRAQIAITLGVRPSDIFDEDGFAIPTGRHNGRQT